jgi:hypothetical protein
MTKPEYTEGSTWLQRIEGRPFSEWPLWRFLGGEWRLVEATESPTDDELRVRVGALLECHPNQRDLWPPCERCGGVPADLWIHELVGEPPLGVGRCECETERQKPPTRR